MRIPIKELSCDSSYILIACNFLITSTDQPEGRMTTEDIVANRSLSRSQAGDPAIVVSKPSPEAEAATEGTESPADKDNVSYDLS